MTSMVEGNKLFVGQVPNATTEQELRDLFGPYGSVTDVMFLKNKATGQHRGCAFITFATPEEAMQSISSLHEQVTLPGAKRSLIIRVAGGNRSGQQNEQSGADTEHKLYIAMLSHATTVEDLRSMFEPYGIVQDAFLMHEKDDVSKSRGCGFIKYGSREDCLRAITALHGKHTDKDAPQTIQVKFAHTKAEKDNNQGGNMGGFNGNMMQPFMQMPNMGMGGMGGWQQQQYQNQDPYANVNNGFQNGMGPDMGFQNGMMQQQQQQQFPGAGMGMGMPNTGMPFNNNGGRVLTKGPPGANLFVYGIPDSYRDPDLSTLFYGFGAVISAKVQLDLTTGRSKGFGFVSFDSTQNAQAAIAAMDGFILQGKKLNVRVKKGAGETGGQQRFSPY